VQETRQGQPGLVMTRNLHLPHQQLTKVHPTTVLAEHTAPAESVVRADPE
jgi:hypothetical protein